MATATTDTKAQDTNKGTAPAAAKPTMTKADIIKALSEGSTDAALFEQLKKLNEGEASLKKEKAGAVTKLVAEMEKYGITMLDLKAEGAPVPDIDQLFDANTIKLAGGATKATRAAKSTDGTPKVKGPSKALMIALPANGKRPAGYGKGDSAKLGTYTKPAFKELFTKHGDKFESVMKDFVTDAGKEYFATPEGKKEWTSIIDHIKTKKAQPATAAK